MKYEQALKQLGKDFDPFLHLEKDELVDETERFFVIPARAPYVENHLLIIPKRKVYVLRELTGEEKEEMYDLVDKRSRKLHTLHNWVNLLLRDGLVGNWDTEIQKSVNHLHFHLIPDCPIWNEFSTSDRRWYSDEEYLDLAKEIRIKFLGISE